MDGLVTAATRPPGMHRTNFNNSRQLQRVHAYLLRCGLVGATTREIIAATGDCAINTLIHSLRLNGFVIDCFPEGMNAKGQNVYRYVIRNPEHQPS